MASNPNSTVYIANFLMDEATPVPVPVPVSTNVKVATEPALKYTTVGSFSWDQDTDKVKLPLEFDNKRFIAVSVGLLSLIYLGANFIPSAWDAFQFTGATAAVCIGFIFPASVAIRDVHGISTKGDKILAVLMIGLAVFANVVAICSDVYALFKRNPSPRA